MSDINTISTIGHYCGRFAPGFLGEPLNSFSNIGFIIGALYALRKWHSRGAEDRWQLLLFILAALIGMGSFIFHSIPSQATLWGDLVPIQIFGLAFFGYVLLRYLRLSYLTTVILLLTFFLVRQFWLAAAPRGAWGGGITHAPTLLLLMIMIFIMRYKGFAAWRYMAAASISYVLALIVRSWDLAVCSFFPWGLHWAWHLLTALTASLLVLGIVVSPPRPLLHGARAG